jgi:putative nucleotidyltransferase with HDIG domain
MPRLHSLQTNHTTAPMTPPHDSNAATPSPRGGATERAEAIGSSVSEAVLVVAEDLRVIWGNQSARARSRAAGGVLEGRPCHEVLLGNRRPCDPAHTECPIATARLSGQPESCDKLLPDATGRPTPCTVSAHPVLGPGGELVEVVLTLREHRAGDEVWRIVQQQSDDLSLVHSLTELANRGCELDDLLSLLSRSISTVFGGNSANVYWLGPRKERLDLLGHCLPPKLEAAIERVIRCAVPRVSIALERAPLMMAALHSERSVVLDDPGSIRGLMAEHTDNAILHRALGPIQRILGIKQVALLPLVDRRQIVGLLVTGREHPYTDPELRRLEHIASQVAGIMVRRRLQEEHRLMVRRQSLMLQAVAEGIVGLNGDGEVVFANAAASSMLGRRETQLSGVHIHQLCAQRRSDGTDCLRSCAVEASLEDRRPRYDVEGCLLRQAQGLLPVMVSAVPLEEPNLSLVLTLRDLTDQLRHRETEQRATERLRRSFSGTVAALRHLAEMRDPYTAGHERRVAELARAIAQHLDLDEELVDTVRLAATIHDIGKHAVPVEILTKPGTLAPHEMELIRTHPLVGWEILHQADFPGNIATVVRQHHERLDGTGYPDGISGEAITMEARIIAVADVVEAMASHRPYRPSLGLEKALYEVQAHRETRYDPQVVAACVRVFRTGSFSFA